MSAAKPKFYIASNHSNRIGYRKLTAFEERNPKMFELSHRAFDNWEDAHAWMLECRISQVKRANSALASAEKQLAKAKAMSKPEGA